VALDEVSNILWRERHLLELLLFKLEEEQLVLAAGRARLLAHATREVELVLEEIQRAEVERALLVDALAAELGLPPGPSLRQLADAVDEPWKSVFAFHRQGFLDATEAIVALAGANRDLLARGAQAAQEALRAMAPIDTADAVEAEAYSATGAVPLVRSTTGRLVNEAL